MISHPSQNIRYHSPSNTYIISKKSFFDQDVLINGNVVVGPSVSFWKNVKIQGNAKFGKGCIIEGRLDVENVLIGSQSVVKGPIHANGDISLFQNVAVKSIESSGNIVIMEGCTADYVNGKRLEIIGKAQVKKIGAIAKMAVKANNMNSSNDIEGKNIENSELEMLPDCDFETEINTENDFETLTDSLQPENDHPAPPLPMENEEEDAEFIISGYPKPKLSEIASVPQDEMLDVELISCEADEKNETANLQTVQTPFGSFVVNDNSNTPKVPSALDTASDPILDSDSDADSKSQTSSSPQDSSPKRKPYPDFVPMAVPAEEKKKSASQKKSSMTSNQAPNRAAENKSLPDLENDSASSKIIFEILPSKTKTDKEEVKIAKTVKKPAKDIETERANSKLWYEERVRPMQKVPKKYPPYL